MTLFDPQNIKDTEDIIAVLGHAYLGIKCCYEFFEQNHKAIIEIIKTITVDRKYRPEICPRLDKIFDAFKYSEEIKVVILGQDPYHNGYATGRSFDATGRPSPPKSLLVIYKLLEKTVSGFKQPCHSDLRSWARQGVLLLNTSLTTERGVPGAHIANWKVLIDALINYILETYPKAIFVLWGQNARKTWKKRNGEYVEGPHPANRSSDEDNPFLHIDHFNDINEYLDFHNMGEIDWCSICGK